LYTINLRASSLFKSIGSSLESVVHSESFASWNPSPVIMHYKIKLRI
jgi:hypothetical protein